MCNTNVVRYHANRHVLLEQPADRPRPISGILIQPHIDRADLAAVLRLHSHFEGDGFPAQDLALLDQIAGEAKPLTTRLGVRRSLGFVDLIHLQTGDEEIVEGHDGNLYARA